MPLARQFLDSSSSSSSSKGVKRKWSLRDGSTDMEADLPFCRSSSSSDSKASLVTMSSLEETDEESSVDVELDFSLHIGNEKTPVKKKASSSSSNKPFPNLQDQVDQELTLSSTPTSSITSLSEITHHHHHRHTNYCLAHGGGKRCQRHGGGKRCKFEGCGKSAQGSSDFCKVHGALVQDDRVHGGATLGPLVHDTKSGPLEKVTYENMNVDTDVMASRFSEGRVHGGSLIAFLTGASSGSLLDLGKVKIMPQKLI